MKHSIKGIILPIILVLFSVGSANAQMDNLANMSAKWVRSNVRNAALDGGADMVNFNPAGLSLLDDGIYISLSNQTLFRHPEHSFNLGTGEKSYEQDGIDPFLPMCYAAWKKGNMAISSGIYISGGGASVNYPDGSININLMGYKLLIAKAAYGYTSFQDQSLEASSYYLTVPLNFSYAVNDQLSFSVGGRYIRGINKTKANITLTESLLSAPDANVTVDYATYANGFGGVFGVNYKATEKLNIALHYETRVKLNFETEDNKGNYQLQEDGVKNRRDLPAVLYAGVSYDITDKLMAEVDFNYYFQTNADWGTFTDPTEVDEEGDNIVVDASDAAGNCYTANLGFIYSLNEKLELSAGCSYTAFNYDDMELYYTKMGLYEALKYNNLNVGLGAGYNVTDNIQVDLGFSRTFWKDKTIKSLNAGGLDVDVTDSGYVLAIGVDLRF